MVMITIIPHEDLYEQFVWPSIFNDDHKATFRVNTASSWSPVSINIREECMSRRCKVISCVIHDENYDYGLIFLKSKKTKKSNALE